MPEKPIQSTDPQTPGRRVKKCKTCKRDNHGVLLHGECADCAGLVALPLRGEGGRFLSFGPKAGER